MENFYCNFIAIVNILWLTRKRVVRHFNRTVKIGVLWCFVVNSDVSEATTLNNSSLSIYDHMITP